MSSLQDAIAALRADAAQVDAMVAHLPAEEWATPTPAAGWTVAHQIGHLAFVFSLAGMAAGRPEAFTAMARTVSVPGQFDAVVNRALAEYVALTPADLLARWRRERDAGIAALAALDPDGLVPWLVNPLPPVVLAGAGMLELFAHGQDVADALGVTRPVTDRLAHVVHFVVRTRDFGYAAHGLTAPAEPFRFEVALPSGAELRLGPADAEQRVTGPALDLCLLASRRRHPDDVAVKAVGEQAEAWLSIAQAYRGPAGSGREPGHPVD